MGIGPYGGYKGCVGEGLCPSRGRPQGSPLRRVTSSAVRGKNPPVTASPCQPPLGKGAEGTGEADCHSQCAHWLRNDREFYMGCGGISGGRTGASAPTEMSEHLRRAACPHAAVMVRWLTGGGLRAARPTEAYFAVRRGGALPLPRATARVAPTEGNKKCGGAGRPGGRPLRRRDTRCGADKGRPGGPPLRFLYPLFICALRRINLPGAGVCPCRPTRCGPRPGAFPGRWLFPPDRSRCGVRPGSPGPGL